MNDEVRLNSLTVARRCACRGWIVGPTAPGEITLARTIAHQESEPHRSWDSEAWIEENTAQVDVPIARLRRVG